VSVLQKLPLLAGNVTFVVAVLKLPLVSLDGPLAQSVEQLTLNQRVPGSSPGRLTKSPVIMLVLCMWSVGVWLGSIPCSCCVRSGMTGKAIAAILFVGRGSE
jgi:hypothetical protein